MPTVLVTGANRGLGFEFVQQYAADGWNVIATCRDPAKADKLKALAKKHAAIRIEEIDVTDTKSITVLATKLNGVLIDLLINNAGIFSGNKPVAFNPDDRDKSQDFGTIDPDAWAKVLYTNTIAPVLVTQALLPNVQQSKEPKIIMISSSMGSIAEADQGFIAYRTSKSALNSAMRNISHALKAKKITVVSLHPGWTQTDMGGSWADIKPDVSISGMRKVIAGLTIKNTGQFLRYSGEIVPW